MYKVVVKLPHEPLHRMAARPLERLIQEKIENKAVDCYVKHKFDHKLVSRACHNVQSPHHEGNQKISQLQELLRHYAHSGACHE